MTETFEHDFDTDQAATGAAAETVEMERQAEPAPDMLPPQLLDEQPADLEDEEEEPADEDFFAESAAAAVPEIDPATLITIRTSTGSDKFVEAPSSLPLVDAITRSGLRFNGDFTCWLNGQEVPLGTLVSGGMTVTVVGSVKGGNR